MNNIIMLPTQKAEIGTVMKHIKRSDFCFSNEEKPISFLVLNVNPLVTASNECWEAQNLYEISDEELTAGDWALSLEGNVILQVQNPFSFKEDVEGKWKKIIATTNKSLVLPIIGNEMIKKLIELHNKKIVLC